MELSSNEIQARVRELDAIFRSEIAKYLNKKGDVPGENYVDFMAWFNSPATQKTIKGMQEGIVELRRRGADVPKTYYP